MRLSPLRQLQCWLYSTLVRGGVQIQHGAMEQHAIACDKKERQAQVACRSLVVYDSVARALCRSNYLDPCRGHNR